MKDVHHGIISALLDRLQAMTDWNCRARWLLEDADVTWTSRTTEQEAALIVERVNGWEALVAERDGLRATVATMRAALNERVAERGREMDCQRTFEKSLSREVGCLREQVASMAEALDKQRRLLEEAGVCHDAYCSTLNGGACDCQSAKVREYLRAALGKGGGR